MTGAELVALARKLGPPFLEDLAPPEINKTLAAARQRRFLANSVITNQGHPASHTFMVLTGGARSFFSHSGWTEIALPFLSAREMFGGMALVPRASDYMLSTEAVRDSHTLAWDRTSIRSLAAQHPKLLDNALWIESNYLNAALATLVALSCHTARQRLAEVLVNLASGS
jgi:CRP-like cAMP-binding protein